MVAFVIVVLVVVGALLAVLLYRERHKPVPVPQPEPNPEPAPVHKPKFGLAEAEALASRVGGGMTSAQVEAAKVTAMVVGMDYSLVEEVTAERSRCESAIRQAERSIKDLKARVSVEEEIITKERNRENQVVALAATFGLQLPVKQSEDFTLAANHVSA